MTKTNSTHCIINKLKSYLKLKIYKAYSSEVERTAHNGFVVGSNPTKPNLNEIKTKNL